MATYEIVQTPGKNVVWPRPERPSKKDPDKTLPADPPIRSQEEAKIKIAELRAELAKQGKNGDFLFRTLKDAGKASSNGSPGQATSVRLNESSRQKLAKFTGHVMMETGRNVAMGEAIEYLLAHYERTKDSFAPTPIDHEELEAADA